MKKTFLWLIVISLVVVLLLAGCKSAEEAAPVEEEPPAEEAAPAEEEKPALEIPLTFSYDPDMAKAILADAGYVDTDGDGFVESPDGSKIELTVTCPFGWTDWMEAISVIAQSAQAVGINLVNETPDQSAWNDALVNGTFHSTLNNWAMLSNTPWTLYNLMFNHPIKETMGSGNFGRYENQEIFDLVDQLAATPMSDKEAIQSICEKIQTIHLTEMPMIPLWYNGAWAQYTEAAWTNWPTAEEDTPDTLPVTWNGYWQMGGLLTLTTLEPVEGVEPGTGTYPRNETLYISGAAWGPANDWNPFITWSKANTTGTCGLLYESPFMYDPLTNELTPFLAESGEWTDDSTYVMKIREGIKWTDGQTLDANDVKFTYELGKQYSAIWFSPMWNYLNEITLVDDYTLEFKFTDPLYQEWENNLYNIFIVPEHIWKNRTEEEITAGRNENPVGSGAYMYEGTGPDRNIWKRNENWWAKEALGLEVAPKYIVDILFSSNNVALGSLLKGEVDLSNNFLPGIAELVDKGYVKTYYPEAPYMVSANTAILFLNTTIKPMDDPAFRKALAFAINTDDIVNIAYAGLVAKSDPTGLMPHLSDFIMVK
ncbi:MAG: ABC transporter substrate-binding protein [Actinomycetota bacterium]|nr:ABC transporter substrate-binding protein [Actinomycetota bacterium]